MSLVVTVHISEGIVLASDSRLTFTTSAEEESESEQKQIIKKMVTHLSDEAEKIYLMDNRIAIAYCGNSLISGKPISFFIEKFIKENTGCNINELPTKILDYFKNLDDTKNTTFIIAGYDNSSGNEDQVIYKVFTKIENGSNIIKYDTEEANAFFAGSYDIPMRLCSKLYTKSTDPNSEEPYKKYEEYDLNIKYFNIQDAINFANFLVNTTIEFMKYQKRIKVVGGPIDIVVIKPEEAIWVQRKEMHV